VRIAAPRNRIAAAIPNPMNNAKASFVGVAANRRDNVRAAGARHLHRIAADPAGRAHHNEALGRGDAQQLE
jgi:hypothetical protein